MRLSDRGDTVQDMQKIDQGLTDTVKSVTIAGGRMIVAQPDWSDLDWQRVVFELGLQDREVHDQDMGLLSTGHLFWWVPNE